MQKSILLLILFLSSFLNESIGSNEVKAICPMSDEAFLQWKETALPLDVGLLILEHSEQQLLSEVMTAEAESLLSSADLFVQAAAEWALSLKVGNENMTDVAKWPMDKNPEWYLRWYDIPLEKRIELDWCRQAIAAGISQNPKKMIAQIEEMVERVTLQIQNNSFRPEDLNMINNVSDKLNKLVKSATSLNKSKNQAAKIQEYWLEARRLLRPVVFANKDIDFDSVIFYTRFAAHHKPNVPGVSHNGTFKPGGDITIVKGLNKTISVNTVIGDKLAKGHIHGMDLHFDGEKLVFGYGKQLVWPPKREAHHNNNSSWGLELRQSLEPVSLYEMEINGSGLKQLTSHPVWSDTEPVYCPNDDIAFSSERSSHSPSCDYEYNDVTDVNLYLLQRKSNTIRRLTNNRDIDMTPRLLDNGLLSYLRWEYQERNFNEVHSIWTIRPDGTNPDALYKQHIPAPYALREVRSIPNTNKLVAIAAGHHCYSRGPIIVVDPTKGGNNPEGMENMTPGVIPQESAVNKVTKPVEFGGVEESRGYYRNPYPLSETVMLASYSYASPYANPYKNEIPDYKAQVESNGFGLYIIDSYGNKELIYRHPLYCSVDVAPLKKRKRPVVMPDRVSEEKNYATCVIANIYEGMAKEVEPGSIKYIRISQHLPTPLDENGRARKFAFGPKFWGSLPAVTRWTSVREIGLVPVEKDGSAHFKVPTAGKASVYFQALDEKYMEVVRMRSSVSFQPGEVRSCTGCHETQNYRAPSQLKGLANSKPAVMPQNSFKGYAPFDYEMMVQPILDRNCIECHSGKNKKTQLDLTDKKIMAEKSPEKFNQSYKSILGPTLLGQDEESLVVLNDRMSDGSITQAKQFGSHKSKLIKTLLKEHHKVKLTKDEWYTLVTWIDYNAPYHGKLINRYPADGSLARREVYPWPDPWQNDTVTPAISNQSMLPKPSIDTTLLVSNPLVGKILRYNMTGKITWKYTTDSCTDMHMLENGNIVIADGSYVKEVDRRGKAILKYRNSGKINSCQPLSNGFTLATDSKNNQLLMLNRKMKLERTIPLQGNSNTCNIKVRVGSEGTYFVTKGTDQFVGEYSEEGKLLRRIAFGNNVYCIVPTNNGNLIMGGKGGIKIVDIKDNITWSLKSEDVPEVNLQSISNIVLLPNGNLLVTNKIENRAKTNGLNLFEVNPDKKLVQTFSRIENSGTPKCMAISGVYYDLPSKIKHRFATVDIRTNKAMIVSENNEVEWHYDVNTPTDIQVLKNGNILVAGIRDVVEINLDGDVIWNYSSNKDLFSAVATKNGNYLIGCSEEFKLVELDKNQREKRVISTATQNKNGHMHSRHVRKFKDGTYWVTLCADGLVNSYNTKGELLKSISVRKLSEEYGIKNQEKQQAYSIEELENGHVLISAGFPAFVAEIDNNGKLVWGLGAEDVPTANFIFSGGTKRLSNGNTIICNWTGHNCSDDYIPIFEVNREKQIVWSFNDIHKLPEPLGIAILE